VEETRMNIDAILAHFSLPGAVVAHAAFGNGHINDTYRVQCREGDVIVQRINHHIFRTPLAVMDNIVRVLTHLQKKLPESPRHLRLISTRSGNLWLQTDKGEVWRAYSYLVNTKSIERVEEPHQAFVAAEAFARFLANLADLPGKPLATVLPGFHDTVARLAQLQAAVQADPCGRAAEAAEDIRWALAQEQLAGILSRACQRGEMHESVTHNDTKISNILFEADGRSAACVIDLDTLMPGVVLNDFADLARSASCRAAEDGDPGDMVPDPALLEALVNGWLSGRGAAATAMERALMPDACAVITYEQGIRFLADHVLGDTYYRIHHPGHNLQRARAQLALARGLIARRGDIVRYIGAQQPSA